MKEEKLIELLDENEVDVEMDKKIERKVRLNIVKKIVLVTIGLYLLLFLFWCISFSNDFDDASRYNPYNEDEVIIGPNDQEGDGFHILMTDYFNLHCPGYVYYGTTLDKDIHMNYEFSGRISYVNDFMMYGDGNITGVIDKKQLSINTSDTRALTRMIGEFGEEAFWNENDWDEETVMSDIKSLPDSCMIDVAINFKDIDTLEETVDFMQAYPNSRFHWIATSNRDTNCAGIYAGIPLFDMVRYEMSEEFYERYPEYYLTSRDDADKILTMYLSKLRLLKDHSSFTSLISSWKKDAYTNGYTEYISDLYENVSKNGVTPIGIRAAVTKADLLKMYEKDEFSMLYIHDVMLSKYDRY